MVFECPYCRKKFQSEEERDQHKAEHFQDTDAIPRKARNQRKKKSIIEDYKKNSSESED